MARVKRAVNAVKKRRKILKLAKGYFGTKKKQLPDGETGRYQIPDIQL